MKSGLFRRILAMGLIAAMLIGDTIPTAAETVSGGDAAVAEETEPVTDENTENTNEDVNPAPVETEEEVTDISVSGGDAVEPEEEDIPLEDSLEDIVLKKKVNGVFITLTAPAGALPENAELWAEEIVRTAANKEQIEVIDQALETEADKKEIEVQKYKAFDIKVIADGMAVQPEEKVTVTFEGDVLLPGANEDLIVYHITDDAVANPVGGLNDENTPEMVTDHFSTYVIVVSGDADADGYQVTVSHYLSEDENKPAEERQKFYKSADFQLDKATLMTAPVQGGEDYVLEKVVLKKEDGSVIENINNVEISDEQVAIEISEDTLVEMFYRPTVNDNHMNEVTYFDYSIMSSGIKIEEANLPMWWGIKISCEYNGKTYTDIEYRSNGEFYSGDKKVLTVSEGTVLKNVTLTTGGKDYQADEVKVKKEGTQLVFKYMAEKAYTSTRNAGINSYGEGHETEYLAMGQTGSFHDYTLNINKNGTSLNANVNNAVNGANVGNAIIPNLITGLTGDLKNVITGAGVYEPGYFSAEPLEGKTVYSDRFDLKFSREGHKYILTGSVDNVTGTMTVAGKNNQDFFPLNDVPYEDTAAAVSAAGGNSESLTKGNAFFGMRYDFSFSIGDYEGPLEYTFVGDDDMWVFVDGHRVLDLGGLHQMYPTAYASGKESNVVDLWKAVDENGNLLIDGETEEGKKKVHQITVLYMERGGWDSTCYMEFTVPHAVPLDTVITDKPNGHIEFDKVDEEGKGLEGVMFGLYKNNPDEDEDAVVYKTATSDANGKVTFLELKVGNYYIKEIKALDGYKPSDTVYKATVYSDQVSTINGGTVVNEKIKTQPIDITFKKVFRYDHKVVLAGAEFTLRENDKDGKEIGKAVSGDDGKFTFTGLKEGIYFLEETKAPEGYRTPEAGTGLIINVYEEDGKLNYKITSNNSEQLFYMKAGEENLVKNEKAIDITITKEWKDARGNEIKDTPVDKIQVELRRKCEATKNDDHVADIILSEDNGWTETITGLNYRGDGAITEWNYYVIEKTEVEGYNPVYSDAVMDTTVEGAYKAQITLTNEEESGSLIITKTVDQVDLAYGAPVFTFKITGSDGLVLYRTITFTNETELTRSVTVTNIPVDKYTVEELDTLRYTRVAPSAWETKTVSETETPEFQFTNKLTNDKYYSHSDVIINSFRMDDDGNITISKDRQVTEETKMNAEN